VDGDSQMSRVPGLFAAGECAAGINGANRLGGNSLSDLLVFGKRAGEYAAKFAKGEGSRPPQADAAQVETVSRHALEPLERQGQGGEGPYTIQYDLQDTMQDLVGIVRREDEMKKALGILSSLWDRARKVVAPGNREYNPGWHAALDLRNLLVVSEAITLSAIERRESRGGHFRDDCPDKDPACATFNIVVRKAADGRMELARQPLTPMPPELKQVIEENK